ncbi:molybdenum cofactor guanylyltransferase [Sphingobacterium haloxyli]|nr:molybdenum cofactor guanylyltransferase [Sphingobacterium haloxyli]
MKKNAPTLLGLVLCGGKSSRMGTDKGQLLKGDCTWAEHMCNRLSSLGLQTYLSINPLQQQNYSKIFPTEFLVTDRVDVKGPLAGMLSAHQLFPVKDIFVLPCDMIDIEITILQRLLDIRQQIIHADVYLYTKSSYLEPLCAIYTASGLEKLSVDYQKGHLTNFSVNRAIKNLSMVKLSAAEHRKDFRNYNTPDSVRKWQKTKTLFGTFFE